MSELLWKNFWVNDGDERKNVEKNENKICSNLNHFFLSGSNVNKFGHSNFFFGYGQTPDVCVFSIYQSIIDHQSYSKK